MSWPFSIPMCHGYHIAGSYRVVHWRANAGLLLSFTTDIILYTNIHLHTTHNNITGTSRDLAVGIRHQQHVSRIRQRRYRGQEHSYHRQHERRIVRHPGCPHKQRVQPAGEPHTSRRQWKYFCHWPRTGDLLYLRVVHRTVVLVNS